MELVSNTDDNDDCEDVDIDDEDDDKEIQHQRRWCRWKQLEGQRDHHKYNVNDDEFDNNDEKWDMRKH